MHDLSRRSFMAAGAVLPVAAGAATASADAQSSIADDLSRYIGFGNKQAGGAGDDAAGTWLASELERVGFTIERQEISAPFFEPERCELVSGEAKAPVWAQPIVTPTPPGGVSGPLVRVDANGQADASLIGSIALVELPFGRWSTLLAKPIREPIAAAFAGGAKAVVVITTGPTGKVIALNADGRKPMFPGPVSLLAPEDARQFLAAALKQRGATLFLTGRTGRRPAFNFIGRIDRGRKNWLAVSTPRSGWYSCAGERGPGIAIWLQLARWASQSVLDHDLAFICNTGHEYEYLGASEALKATAPKPAETRFWLHLGAHIAARDWHETPGHWQPLPSVDPQRFLSVSPPLLSMARTTFAGHAGLEVPYRSDVLAGGELGEVVAAGYPSLAGAFGVHRYHHVEHDDARCVSSTSIAAAGVAFQRFLDQVLRQSPT
jgi:hypothetical protein